MNFQEAHKIPLSVILEKLSAVRKRQTQSEEWYLSPFRQERTASFHVNLIKNVWFDFGEEIGGSVIELACEHLKRSGEDYTREDGKRWLCNMTHSKPVENLPKTLQKQTTKLIIEKVTDIHHLSLKRYLKDRGIEFALAKKYLKEVRIRNLEKDTAFYALGMKNEDGGWELRNPFYKGCIGPKAPTFIRGTIPKPTTIDISEGMFDFLTVLTIEKKEQLNGDFLVLNSVSCLNKGTPFIKSYGYEKLNSWLQNDEAGIKASERLKEFVAQEENLILQPMNKKFIPHKDINAWHMHINNLKVQP